MAIYLQFQVCSAHAASSTAADAAAKPRVLPPAAGAGAGAIPAVAVTATAGAELRVDR